jgi:TonB family protein
MKLFLTSLLVFAVSVSIAQQKIVSVAFLKNDGKYVTNKDSADYLRFASEPDSGTVLYNIAEYYKNGKRKLIGKSSKIEPPVFEGQCATFYKNGKRQSSTNYKNGIEVGEEFNFFTNGKLYMVREYPDNNDRYNKYTENFLIKANYDSLGTVLVENGNGYFKGYDESFNYVSDEGAVKNGKRDGAWKGYFKTGKASFTETYAAGELITGKAVYDDSTTTVYSKTRGTPPQFKGGLDAFYQYLGRHVDYPNDAREKNIQGKVIISFVVEKDGKLSDIKVAKSGAPILDEEAVRVMRNCPRWVPGTMFGKPVKVAYSVPINFSLGN